MLTSSDPNVLAKGVRMVAGNRSLLGKFRDLDTQLAKVGGQESEAVAPGAAGHSGMELTQ